MTINYKNMTNTDKNKLASIIIQFLKGQHSQEVETVANNAIDMVKLILDVFPDIDEKVDGYFAESDWDDMVYYLKLKKNETAT